MNKIACPYIIVVEGASDVALLSSFLDADIVTTNGSEVSRETIEYLKEAKKKRDIVVLTDPDSPGKRIRDRLEEEIPGLLHAFVRKEKSIKHHKVGVAESSKDEVLTALSHIIPSNKTRISSLKMGDLYELGLVGSKLSQDKREIVSVKLHVGHCNGKTLLKRLNALGINRNDLEKALGNDK